MARMIRAIDDEVYVEDDAFGLYDTDVSIDSAGSDHWAAVRLEAWDGEPPPADESWETADRLTFEAETGIVALVMPEGTGHDFLIGPPYFEYAVAVYSKGGGDLEEAQERWYEAFEEGVEEPVRGVERWLLRFWPLRDVFDPLRHMRAFPYSESRRMEQVTRQTEPVEVPVPLSEASQWPASQPNEMRPTFEEWLRRQETLLLSTDGVTVHQWLRDHGVPVEDGAEITPEIMWSRTRPGRYRDLLVDRRYARESETDGLPKGFDEWEEHEQVEHLRRLEDDERIAEELNPHQRPTFYVYYGDPMALPGAVRGLTCRMWRWEPEIPWKPVRDGEMTCHREVLARDILRRRILVTAIVTIVRVEEIGGLLSPRYVVRDAEPVEAARVLCAEATWRDDRDPA